MAAPHSPAAARGHEVRRRLLAPPAELVPERGWTAVSTRVLAERAGVTPSVVHYHFPSLPALLNEAATSALREALDEAGEVVDAASTPAAAVDALVTAVDRYTGDDPTSLLAVETYLAATRDETLRAELAAMVDRFRQRVEHTFGAHRVAAPEVTAAVVVAMVDGLLLHRGLTDVPDTAALRAVLHRLLD